MLMFEGLPTSATAPTWLTIGSFLHAWNALNLRQPGIDESNQGGLFQVLLKSVDTPVSTLFHGRMPIV